jgi:hypothetical protein
MPEPRFGVRMPVFVKTGMWSFDELCVYRDGGVECAVAYDLEGVRAAVASGRLSPSVPDGELVTIYPFGGLTVLDGRWELDGAGLIARVERLLDGDQPAWTRGRVDHRRLVRDDGAPGAILPVFVRDPDWQLADLHLYGDGVHELRGLSAPRTIDIAAIAAACDADEISPWGSRGERIIIREYGSLVGQLQHRPRRQDEPDDRSDLLGRVHDMVDRLPVPVEAGFGVPSPR